MLRQKLMLSVAAAALLLAASVAASAACSFTTAKKTMTLNGDCITTASINVPNGFTLDGAGHTITANDPAGDHFRGGIIHNGGSVANVTNVTITASGLSNTCDSGADRLRFILMIRASPTFTIFTDLTLITF